MSLYFFNIVYGGAHVPDDEGMYLRDFAAAKEEAFSSARDLAAVAQKTGDSTPTSIEIVDEEDFVVGSTDVPKTLH